jgi:hypothetical protein
MRCLGPLKHTILAPSRKSKFLNKSVLEMTETLLSPLRQMYNLYIGLAASPLLLRERYESFGVKLDQTRPIQAFESAHPFFVERCDDNAIYIQYDPSALLQLSAPASTKSCAPRIRNHPAMELMPRLFGSERNEPDKQPSSFLFLCGGCPSPVCSIQPLPPPSSINFTPQ